MRDESFDKIINAINKSISKIKEEEIRSYIIKSIKTDDFGEDWVSDDLNAMMDDNNVLYELKKLSNELTILKVKESIKEFDRLQQMENHKLNNIGE